MKNVRWICVALVVLMLTQSFSGCVSTVADTKDPHGTAGSVTTTDGFHTSDVATGDSFSESQFPESSDAVVDPDAWKDKISPEVWDAEPNEEGKRLLAVFL